MGGSGVVAKLVNIEIAALIAIRVCDGFRHALTEHGLGMVIELDCAEPVGELDELVTAAGLVKTSGLVGLVDMLIAIRLVNVVGKLVILVSWLRGGCSSR